MRDLSDRDSVRGRTLIDRYRSLPFGRSDPVGIGNAGTVPADGEEIDVEQQQTKKRRTWPWIVLGLVGALVVVTAVAAAMTPEKSLTGMEVPRAGASSAAPVAAKPKGLPGTMDSGVYQVGTDVRAGRYKTAGPASDDVLGMCYWARLKNDSGEFEAIISNGAVEGPGSVTVQRGEFVELSGGCVWDRVG